MRGPPRCNRVMYQGTLFHERDLVLFQVKKNFHLFVRRTCFSAFIILDAVRLKLCGGVFFKKDGVYERRRTYLSNFPFILLMHANTAKKEKWQEHPSGGITQKD